ncbi:MAG: penicillin acylase family protein [Kofleriaceae bacterium]
MHGLSRLTLLLLALATAAGCSDDAPADDSPYAGITPSRTLTGGGLSAPVDLVRDELGIPHIYAKTEADAAYANGYVLAADRWMQLDLLRHLALGRVGELFGGLDAGQIDSDLVMRMHDFGGRSQAQYQLLLDSSEEDAQAAAIALQRYADGVNAVIAELQAGTRDLDDAQAAFLAPETIEPWTPADSVAIGLLQAWSLSYLEADVELTAARDAGIAAFANSADPERQARARAFDDLFPLAQLDQVSTIDGWPAGGTSARPAPGAPRTTPTRTTHVPRDVLDAARRTLTPVTALGMQWPHPENGSNNWVVAPALAGGKTLLANDPHLQLSNPPLFHGIHLTVPGALDVSGISLAGVPGVVLGHTTGLAWGATTTYHDVLDFHHEVIAPCATGGGDCVTYDGAEVRLETRTETFKVGTLGIITDEFTATYEVVPHHGPILPRIEDHRIVPRAGADGISVQYTGYQPTRELLALYRLNRAQTVDEGFAAMDVFDHGSQNWVMIDTGGHIGWTTSSQMPLRSPGCMTWDPATGLGDAPFFILPGDGSCKWTGTLAPEFVPHAIDPAKGYLVTANADPVGETFDGDPINGPHYAGFDYGPGFREGRITRRLEELIAGGAPLTLDDLASIQGDAHSNTGARLRPFIVDAAADLAEELASPGSHPDLAAFATSLPTGAAAILAAMAARLDAWSLDTPPAVGAGATADEIRDASATTVFNFWQIEFYREAFGDELALLGAVPDRSYTIPAAIRALEAPTTLRTGTLPGDPTSARLCDDLGTVGYETCRLMIVRALEAARIQVQGRFASIDPDDWRWGELHVAEVNSLLPVDALSLPGPGRSYPRHGDTHAVDASNNSVASYTFAYGHGPAMRNLVEFAADGSITQRWALPGGQVFDTRSPHFRDQMDDYWSQNRYADVAWLPAQIREVAEERWVFEP